MLLIDGARTLPRCEEIVHPARLSRCFFEAGALRRASSCRRDTRANWFELWVPRHGGPPLTQLRRECCATGARARASADMTVPIGAQWISAISFPCRSSPRASRRIRIPREGLMKRFRARVICSGHLPAWPDSVGMFAFLAACVLSLSRPPWILLPMRFWRGRCKQGVVLRHILRGHQEPGICGAIGAITLGKARNAVLLGRRLRASVRFC